MAPFRPYLLRAYYDWIVDNMLTPHIVVDAEFPQVVVPTQFVKDGQIVLNISPSAVVQFSMDNYELSFNARFGGQPMRVSVPIGAVLAIFARENGEGTVFPDEEFDDEALQEDEDANELSLATSTEPSPSSDKDKPKKPSHLKVIK
jgi:stringent starvation protein B